MLQKKRLSIGRSIGRSSIDKDEQVSALNVPSHDLIAKSKDGKLLHKDLAS
jgi:hypothetical protein